MHLVPDPQPRLTVVPDDPERLPLEAWFVIEKAWGADAANRLFPLGAPPRDAA